MMESVARTSGRSMLPLIRDRSLVSHVPVRAEDVRPGDVIVFRLADRLVAHRVIGKKTEDGRVLLRQKGDHEFMSSWIGGDALVGRAVSARRGVDQWRLDVDPDAVRVRALVAASRLEADLFAGYMRVRRRAPWLRWPALALALLVAPFRGVVLRILLTAYPHSRRPEAGEEQAFLLRCFRGEPLPPVADWTAVLESVGAQRLAPLALKLLPADAPPPVLDTLKKIGYRAAVRHAAALRTLEAVDPALRARGIGYAVLKGPCLQEAYYRERFPREYDDIDLLVARDRLDEAIVALRSAGYGPVGSRWSLAALRRGHFHITLHSVAPGRPPIELHWGLVDRANLHRIPEADVLARAREWGAGEARFPALSAEDEFIYLCLHAAKHGVLNCMALRRGCPPEWFCRLSTGNLLIWFMDLDLLLREETGLDWGAIAERIAEWNVAKPVSECLRVLRLLRPDSPAGNVLRRLSTGEPLCRDGGALPSRWLEPAMRMNPWLFFRPVRLLLLGRVLFPPPAELLAYYRCRGVWRLPWLYLRHPFHMLRKILGA